MWTGGGGRAPLLSSVQHGLAATVFATFATQLSYIIDSFAALVAAAPLDLEQFFACVGPACAAHVPSITASGSGTLCGGCASRSAFASAFTVAYASACSKHHPSCTSNVHPFSVSLL